jgi:predicted enzyme related to lactoylglutathione lyase
MLNDSKVTANIPAGDLARARDFYADKLGLTPTQELAAEVLIYKTAGGTEFQVYRTDYAGQAYDMPGVQWDGEIASMEGMGRAAWFKDSEGNTMCLDQADAG